MVEHVYDRLRSACGPEQVYMDIVIPDGADYRAHIENALGRCSLCLAFIGPNWAVKRADGTPDFVHHELETLCSRQVPIIPVLVDDAKLPEASSLPSSIQRLLARNASHIDSKEFDYRFDQLLKTIKAVSEHKTGGFRSYSGDPAQGYLVSPAAPSESINPSLTSLLPQVVSPRLPPRRTLALRMGFALAAVALGLGACVAAAPTVEHWFAGPGAAAAQASSAPSQAPSSPGVVKTCSSPWSGACAGGACSGLIQGSERFWLHLSGVYRNKDIDPCAERPVPDLWLCDAKQCLSQREACTSASAQQGLGAHSLQGFEVTGAQLESGLPLQVREGGATGTVLATLRPAYRTTLLKSPFMCTGGAYANSALGAGAGPIAKLSFYLEPR